MAMNRTFNPKFSQGMDIGSVISAPLVAATRANSMMLREQAKFLLEFCFKKNGNTFDPEMIQMSLTRSSTKPPESKNNQGVTKPTKGYFQLPLITLIPFSSLAVDKVNIDFEMEITGQSSYEDDTSKTISSHFAPKGGETKLKGKLSYDSKENINQSQKSRGKTQNSSKLSVNVHASPIPLPMGLTSILDLYVKSIGFSSTEKEPESTE